MCITMLIPKLYRSVSGKQYRSFLWMMLAVYILGYLYCTVFSREWGSGVTIEFRPFMSIVRLFDEPIEGGGKVVGLFAWFMSGAAPITGIILNLLYYPLEYLENSAAVYKFINDQTLTYLNQGYTSDEYTSDEISNMIKLPEALEKNWYTRQYYGTVAHNSKAVYQTYMG